VLVVDGEPAQRRSLARALMARGLVVDTAESGAAALDLLRARPVDVVLMGCEAEVLAQLRRRHPDVEVVLVAAPGDPESVAALRAGAYAVLDAPLSAPEAAVLPVERAAERRRLLGRARALERQLAEHEQLGEVVGASTSMAELVRRARAVGASAAPVLLLGERGTGKLLLARHLHHRSRRSRAPLVTFAPVAADDAAAVAELAVALEQAEGGTLLVDDLGALPRSAQAELLRVLAGPARPDVRVIATARPELREQMARGEVREELFYRIAAVLLEVPPLRRRREDVPLLAYHFAAKFAAREDKVIRRISAQALRLLRAHAWPGNVAELRGVIEHAVVMTRGEVILPGDLPLGQEDDGDERVGIAGGEVLDLPYADAKERAVDAFDRAYVERRMHKTGRNVSEAARMAGMDRSNFRRLLKKVRARSEG
jgi:DNA-binding NtrC family response regulator